MANFTEEQCDFLINIDPMGQITSLRFLNQKAADLLGYTEQDVVGKQVTDFIIDAQSLAGAEHFGRLYASDNAFRSLNRNVRTKDGTPITLESYMIPLYDTNGKFVGHCGMEFVKKSP